MNRFLFVDEQKRERSSYIWNIIAGLINAAEAIVLYFFIVRVTNLDDAGIVSLAFAIGNLLMTIGKYSVRVYQVTDNGRTSFKCFFSARVLTVLGMLVSSVVLLIVCRYTRDYDLRKSFIIFGICFIYMVESIEDVFLGMFQQKGYLDVASKVFAMRWILTLSAMVLVLFVAKSVVFTIAAGMVVTLLSSVFLLAYCFPHFKESISFIFDRNTFEILKKCFPLFAVGFLSFYITNSPKYAIDKYMTEAVQACYGFIFTPVFAIELMSNFLYQPILVRMSKEWGDRDFKAFKRRVLLQFLMIVAILAFVLIVAYFLGIPVLSVLFNADLTGYKLPFMILLVGGGALAMASYLFVVMTIIRRQIMIMVAYSLAALISLLFSNYIIRLHGILGASVLYAGVMTILSLCLLSLLVYCYKKEKGKTISNGMA